MKILITTEWYSPVINGVVTSVINLKKELERLGHEVKILTLSEEKKSYTEKDIFYISSLGVGKIYPGARITLSKHNKLLQEIIDWHPDIIHSQCEFSTFRLAKHLSRQLHIPIVHTYHTVYEDYTHYFSPNQKWGKAMVALFSKKVLKHTTNVIAPTEKVNKLLVGYGVKRPISVIPTGIDLTKFQQSIKKAELHKLRIKLGIPKENKILLFVGRLAKEKNVEEILYYLKKWNPKTTTFLIVGDGPYRETLENYVATNHIQSMVKFAGMIKPSQIAAYYQLADVFISASNSETQGLTYIEAMASGLPLLCKQDPCLDHVIIDGYNGWQFSSYGAFHCYINQLFQTLHLHECMVNNAKERAYAHYSSVIFAKSVEALYYDAISLYKMRPQPVTILDSHS
jgi:1,2-diacylglycerol 3-alpha-glucosyltransferase